MTRELLIEADGGSRGNPGPAAGGAVVIDPATGEVIAEVGVWVGTATNNVAEYSGMLAGVRRALELDPEASLTIRMDSKLVVEQMMGRWKIKHPAMAELEKPQCTEWAEISRGRAQHNIAHLDQRLASSPYVAGDRFTISDITLHVSLGFGRIMKYRPWEEHSHLAAWRERMLARPGLAS